VNRAWPATIVLIALIVFTVFMAQTTLVVALLMALLVLMAGGILLNVVLGTTRITRLRRLIRFQDPRR
jgi:cell division protein FtsW (lipid II flippase)